jgi:hypothetical protein
MRQCKKADIAKKLERFLSPLQAISFPGNVKPRWRSKPSGGIDAGKAITALPTPGL